jgi:hypothetical protein
MNILPLKHFFQLDQVEKLIFSCFLLLLNSTVHAVQYQDIVNQPQTNSKNFVLPEFEVKKSNFEDATRISLFNYKLYAIFTYDTETLLDQVTATSIFTRHQTSLFASGLFPSGLFKRRPANFEDNKTGGMVNNQENIHARHLPGSISFYALVKEQSPTNNLNVDWLGKIEPSEIYASKYFPNKASYADQGRILNLEARIELPVSVEHQHERLQLIVFVDTSPITMDQNIWASELNHTTINGAGLGINWSYTDNFALQAYFSNELENQVLAIPPELSNLFWVQAVKYF